MVAAETSSTTRLEMARRNMADPRGLVGVAKCSLFLAAPQGESSTIRTYHPCLFCNLPGKVCYIGALLCLLLHQGSEDHDPATNPLGTPGSEVGRPRADRQEPGASRDH